MSRESGSNALEARLGLRPQRRRTPLLNRPRIAADRGEIGSHGGGCARTGGIMIPQKCRARGLDFPWTAVTRVAGIGEDLRGRLSGVEVRLCPCRRNPHPGGGRDDSPGQDESDPRHDASPFQLILPDPLLPLFGQMRMRPGRQRPYFFGCCDASALRRPRDFVLILGFRRFAIDQGLGFTAAPAGRS